MTTDSPTDADPSSAQAEVPPPACVLSFNANDPSGAGGTGGDVATIAAMGAHPLPVVTSLLLRDTAEVFDQHPIDGDAIVDQARHVLEDAGVHAFKVGFLGSAENVSAVAEILSDYPEAPLVAYLPNLSWMDDEEQRGSYLDAFRELILPATAVLVGSQQALADFLLPDWDNERRPSARELAVAAAEHGAEHVLVTGILLPAAKGQPQFMDNVLASAQGAITGEKFELFEVSFVGAGDTLSAALASLLAVGSDVPAAVGEALQFLDQSLDAGFRPGMGHVVPDRFFWALPPEDEEGAEPGPEGGGPAPDDFNAPDQTIPPGGSRRVH
jgi:hydroxymethylpyrimidine/phosphomethylpyrimidine kinase